MTLNEILEVFALEVNEKVGLSPEYYDQPQGGAAWHAVAMARYGKSSYGAVSGTSG